MTNTSTHCFHEIFLHYNWHCRADCPLITPGMEKPLHGFLHEYCLDYKGVHFLEIGGTATHIHLLAQVEPIVCPADFIGCLKGASSHEMNRIFGSNALHWMRGYGVVSFAKRNLPGVARYVQQQKEHHANHSTRSKLELYDLEAPEKEFVSEQG